MKYNLTLVATILLMSNLALVPVSAHHAPDTVTAKPAQKLPPAAAQHLSRYQSKTEKARRAYKATVDAEQARLDRALRQDLVAATKRRDFAGAQAILAAIQNLHASNVPKDAKPSITADPKTQIEQDLLGKWSVHVGPKFETVWWFRQDGTVQSVNGAPQGHWKWEPENRRILLTWNETAWDSLNLPLNPKGAFGDTYHRQGWRVAAVKLL